MNPSNLLQRVRSVLTTTPDRWDKMACAVPLDLLSERPAPGEWSAIECLQHLIDSEGVFQSRLSAFRAGRDFPAFNPDQQGTKLENATPEILIKEFSYRREESLRLLEDISAEEFKLSAHHAELGPVTLEQMVNEWAAHDLNHIVQAERAIMQPFLRGCGPWQRYFTDHMVRG
jgi:hypothetical protein